MKRLIALAVAIAVFGIGIGPTIAAGDVPKPKVPPKGIEGPDIRHSTMPPFQSSEGTDVR